jgi:hypothetical protein
MVLAKSLQKETPPMTTRVVLFGTESGTGYVVPGKLQETALLEALVGLFPKGAVTVGTDTEGGGGGTPREVEGTTVPMPTAVVDVVPDTAAE